MFNSFRSIRPGQTLIEVVIATLIAAMTTLAVFSVVLSSSVSPKKADKKEISAMMLKQAQQTLQTFVSAQPGDPAYSPTSSKGPGIWPADASGTLALSAGHHDITSLMPTELLTNVDGTSCAATCFFTYDVADDHSAACVGGSLGSATELSCKTVTFNIKYAD